MPDCIGIEMICTNLQLYAVGLVSISNTLHVWQAWHISVTQYVDICYDSSNYKRICIEREEEVEYGFLIDSKREKPRCVYLISKHFIFFLNVSKFEFTCNYFISLAHF